MVLKKVINSSEVSGATYKKYNANNRGNNAPDCVKRAIAMAFNKDYNEVSRLLINKAKELHKPYWNVLQVFEPVIYELGGNKGQEPDTLYRVNEFIDEVVPNSVCIMETSKHPNHYGKGNHLTCSVNGVLYDSWDSSDQFVCQYYIVENVTHEFTDIQDHLDELIAEGEELATMLCQKYKEKYSFPGQATFLGGGHKNNYAFYFTLLYDDREGIRERWHIDCVFTPTMTLEAARKKMIETIKIRLYDRFYAINQKYKKKAEGDALFYESGYTDEDRAELWLDSREKKFFNSLPGWIRPFIVYLNIQDPGQWSDSYNMTILPIKGDPDRSKVHFYGYQSAEVRDQIERYKKNFERVDIHYSFYEEY